MTAKITAYKEYNYYERLKALKLYSLQRRRERFTIIYTWKIIESLCPNLPNNPITVFSHVHKGRLCKVPPINTKSPMRIQTIKENSLAIRGPRLFNVLPRDLWEKTNITTNTFKHHLDGFLTNIDDEPPVEGYYRNQCNSLISRCTGTGTNRV